MTKEGCRGGGDKGMKFSLINVVCEREDKIEGYWMQDHVGTIKSAKERAAKTNAVNSNRLNIAVVEQIPFQNPLNYLKNLVHLEYCDEH